jgi:hypothetical protein
VKNQVLKKSGWFERKLECIVFKVRSTVFKEKAGFRAYVRSRVHTYAQTLKLSSSSSFFFFVKHPKIARRLKAR